jgi:hypothetical protein
MEFLESLLGGLAMLTEPYWLTIEALGGMIAAAGAGTALVAAFVLIVALDFLRSSKGAFVPVSRVVAVAATVFFVSSLVFGDFLAAPAKAAYSAIVARVPAVPSRAVVLSTLGAAGAGIFYYAGRKSAPEPSGAKPLTSTSRTLLAARRDGAFAREITNAIALDAAGRLQLRQLARNSKKRAASVRSRARMMPQNVYWQPSGRRVAYG